MHSYKFEISKNTNFEYLVLFNLYIALQYSCTLYTIFDRQK